MLWQLWGQARRSKADADAPDKVFEPSDDDPMFATETGKRLGTFRKGLSDLLKAANLLTDHHGKRRECYSFRHFHISQHLMNGVDGFVRAKNTGTRPKMIDEFYGQVRLELMKDHLRPSWQSRQP
jgi:hypothetical protein